jgi:NADH-quinone oxidoreductase subunit H
MQSLLERIPPWFWIGLVVHVALLGTVAYLILLERKVASWVQDRLGPNRVGFDFGIIPFLKGWTFNGLGQPLADGLKFLLKEDYRPRGVDKVLFTLAPAIMIITVIISIAVIPWGGTKQGTKQFVMGELLALENTIQAQRDAMARERIPAGTSLVGSVKVEGVKVGELRDGLVYEVPPEQATEYVIATATYRYPFQIANLNIGVLFILAVLSLAVYGVVIGGWASNNKYSFLGGLRATANMISYEIPLGLAVLAIVVMFGSLDLAEIVNKQAHYWGGFWPAWNVFCQPLAFLLFLVCIHAEANRAPFDMAEAEQELVGGYHTEYSAMRFALFFLAEYLGMITTSAVCVALFFGGWHFPGLGDDVVPGDPGVTTSLTLCIIRAIVFFTKTLLIIFVFMWVRWSLPRFRFDQLMMIAWRAMIPISLALLMITAVVVYLFAGSERAFMRVNGRMALALLVANAALLGITMVLSMILPAAPETNRKFRVPNSRFARTPLPGSGTQTVPALDRGAAEKLPVGQPAVAGRVGS